MFQLNFSPRFAKQEKAFLELNQAPALILPGALEEALHQIDSETIRENKFSFRHLWFACLKAGRKIFIKATFSASFASLCGAGSTLIAVNLLKSDTQTNRLLLFAAGYFALNALSQLGNFVTNRLRAELSLTIEATLIALISHKILALSSEVKDQQSSGNLKVLITSDIKNISDFLNNVVRNLIPSLASLAIMAPLLIHFSGNAGWFGLLSLFLILPISIGLNQISIHFQRLSQARMDEHATLASEWVKNIRLVRFLSWDTFFESNLKTVVKRFMRVAVVQHFMACIIFGLSTTWWMISGASVLLFSKWTNSPLAMSGFFGSLWLLTFIAGYFTHLPNTIRIFGIAVPSMQRITTFLNQKEQSEDFDASAASINILNPVLVIFENVSFRTLKNINVQIRLHQKTAILGEVGSGKTTFLKLLCGEFPPSRGKIWIQFEDGSRSSLWQKEVHQKFRQMLALVPQVPYVSSDLLSSNISLSSNDHNEADLLSAIQKAQMEEDLSQLEHGLHQMIGESGVNLSGGQKQRLNLARALHAHRSYLVLDDTLSALDHRTEAALMEKLCKEDTGILLVTHRLSEIKRLGYVLVFRDGRLIEEGKPDVLSQKPNSAFTRVLEAYSHV